MTHFPSDSYVLGAANRDPEDEALAWIVRMTSGDATEEDEREFANWHDDPDNAVAWVRASALWGGLGAVLEKQQATGWPAAYAEPGAPAVRKRAGAGRARYGYVAAVAAMLLVASITGGFYARYGQYDYVSGSAVADNVRLTDGSHVTIGPDTAFSSDFTGGARHVSLARGEIYFDVRHDPARPFVVSTDNGMVRVLGTAFTVRRRDDDTVTVTVARGCVQVTSGARSLALTPDRQVSFGEAGLGPVRVVDAQASVAWTHGRLIMENRALTDVLAEVDRYSSGRIVLLNREAGRRQINAVIDLSQTDGWLRLLASSQGLKLTKLGPVTLLR